MDSYQDVNHNVVDNPKLDLFVNDMYKSPPCGKVNAQKGVHNRGYFIFFNL